MSITKELLLLILITLISPSLTNGFGINLMKVPDEDRSQVICTMALLNKYFRSGEPLSGSLLSMSITSAAMHIQQSLLRALHADKSYPWTVVIKDARHETPITSPMLVLHEKPQCYFVIIENLEDEDLEDIFEDWRATINWNPLAQFVVYLASVEETDEEMTELMIEILLNFMNIKIYNVNVIGQNEENGFYYGKTVFPYHPDNNCGNRVIAIETLDICDYQETEQDDEEDEETDEYDEEEQSIDDNENGENYNDTVEDDDGKDADVDEDEENCNEGETDDENEGAINKDEDDNQNNPSDNEENVAHNEQDENNDQENALADESVTDNEKNGDEDDLKHDVEQEYEEHKEEESEYETKVIQTDNSNNEGAGNSLDNDEDENNNEEIDEKEIQKSTDDYQIEQSREINYDDNINANYKKDNNNDAQSIEQTEATKTPIAKRLKHKRNKKRMKRQMTALADDNNVTETSGKIYLEELYRALFLDKFPKDLSGCPLAAAYRPWEPYIFNEENRYYNENYVDTEYTESSNIDNEYVGSGSYAEDMRHGLKLSGIEYKMVQTIAERLHISIDIQVENKNLYHLFQQLIDGDIEMVFGGIDEDPSISQYVSSTIPYHQDDLTWCVAKAKRTYNLFNFLASFRIATWALTFTFVAATAMTIIFIQKALKVKITYLQGYFTVTIRIYGVLFSQAIQLKRLPSALKICLGTAFFMGLMFSNVYHSFLISTLTTPKNSYQISHLDEIYRQHMSIMGSVENVRHLNKDGEIFKYIREQFQMCYNIEECLIRAANDDRIAVAVSRQHTFYNPRIPRDQLYCFDRDENIYVYLVTLLLPKKFHLLHKINPIIQHVIESGHMQKWARDLDMKRKIKEEVNRAREEPVKSLTLAEVGGSFVFTGILLLFALLVFLTECWVHWMVTKRKTRLKLIKMLHRQFK